MTEVYLDTANVEEIEEFYFGWDIISGITTNQNIFLKEKGCNFEERVKEILDFGLPTSIEGPNNFDGIVETALSFKEWEKYRNIVIKVPMIGNGDGIKAVKILKSMGMKTNVTACMNLNQVFLAALSGATYVSLFYRRMCDMEGKIYALSTIEQAMNLLQSFKTRLIIGSIRESSDIEEILKVQPHIITIPPKILRSMPFNVMTEKTLKEFEKAWEEFCGD